MTFPAAKPAWHEMDDETRAIAYSPSSALDGPIDPFIAAYTNKSKAAYAACPGMQTMPYDLRASNTIDFVAPDSDTPVPLHIFIHGGYWQQLSSKESFFPAIDTLSRGLAFAAVDYTLAPEATIDQISDQCCTAIARLMHDAERININSNRVVISGSSAGAHLAAMCCLKLPASLQPTGVILMSGIYELEPLIGTYINDAVKMDISAAKRNSPAFKNLSNFPKAVVAWGAQETAQFK